MNRKGFFMIVLHKRIYNQINNYFIWNCLVLYFFTAFKPINQKYLKCLDLTLKSPLVISDSNNLERDYVCDRTVFHCCCVIFLLFRRKCLKNCLLTRKASFVLIWFQIYSKIATASSYLEIKWVVCFRLYFIHKLITQI